jgi:hypothetical protein
MVSYNDITKLTFFYENKLHNKLIEYVISLCGSNNILDILHFIKDERYVEETSNIKINYDSKELVIFKENFLTDLPTKKSESHILNDFEYIIGYPDILEYTCSPMHCIKKIIYCGEEHMFNSTKDYNVIPVTMYTELKPIINKYIEDLQKVYVYSVGKIQSRFFFNIDLIINIIYLAFVTSYKHLVQEQLFLMKEFNFTHESFSKITPHEIKHYVKEGVKLINERNNSET